MEEVDREMPLLLLFFKDFLIFIDFNLKLKFSYITAISKF